MLIILYVKSLQKLITKVDLDVAVFPCVFWE